MVDLPVTGHWAIPLFNRTSLWMTINGVRGGGGGGSIGNMSQGGEFEGRIYVSWGVLGCMCIIVCPGNRERGRERYLRSMSWGLGVCIECLGGGGG